MFDSIKSLKQTPITRRSALLGGAAAIAGTAALPSLAADAKSEVVIGDWGGISTTAFKASWQQLLASKYGINLAMESGGPSPGKLRAMVESGKVIWDICDTSFGGTVQLGDLGILEPIDYNIVDRSKVRPGFALKYGVCNYMYSYVMAVNAAKFEGKPVPRTWADFYDLKKFPGRRTMRALFEGQLEGALLADGVDPKNIYPIDVNRALAKINSIKSQVVFWSTGAESENLLRQGEVVMGGLWSGRANVLRLETNGKIGWSWEGAVLAPAAWAVPKGNPAGREAAMRLIAALQDPEGQAAWFKEYGAYPANSAAAALTPADLKPFDGSQPENAAAQVQFDIEWYGKNSAAVQTKYLEMMSS